ncbi:MAG TPA: hypothetical protein VN240_08230 [Propylenella sp.]|nr:hypothetical protein [Propylenella sp.]
MILLTATRMDVCERFRFKIEPDDEERVFVTSDPVKAARILHDLGVEHPLQLVEHATEWGSVEILEPGSSDN